MGINSALPSINSLVLLCIALLAVDVHQAVTDNPTTGSTSSISSSMTSLTTASSSNSTQGTTNTPQTTTASTSAMQTTNFSSGSVALTQTTVAASNNTTNTTMASSSSAASTQTTVAASNNTTSTTMAPSSSAALTASSNTTSTTMAPSSSATLTASNNTTSTTMAPASSFQTGVSTVGSSVNSAQTSAANSGSSGSTTNVPASSSSTAASIVGASVSSAQMSAANTGSSGSTTNGGSSSSAITSVPASSTSPSYSASSTSNPSTSAISTLTTATLPKSTTSMASMGSTTSMGSSTTSTTSMGSTTSTMSTTTTAITTTTTSATTTALVSPSTIAPSAARDYFTVSFRITNLNWNSDYGTSGSDAFNNIKQRVANYFSLMLQAQVMQTILSNWGGADQYSFSSGSVITNFRAAVQSGAITASAFQTQLQQAVSATPSNGDITVDPNSVTVTAATFPAWAIVVIVIGSVLIILVVIVVVVIVYRYWAKKGPQSNPSDSTNRKSKREQEPLEGPIRSTAYEIDNSGVSGGGRAASGRAGDRNPSGGGDDELEMAVMAPRENRQVKMGGQHEPLPQTPKSNFGPQVDASILGAGTRSGTSAGAPVLGSTSFPRPRAAPPPVPSEQPEEINSKFTPAPVFAYGWRQNLGPSNDSTGGPGIPIIPPPPPPERKTDK